ncbi:hypothetical protein [Helicobacter bizzozeronii]|uniref:hypothetical protein n=1 Tax=Helicobacter bizzozeronii TaxID=56877 RepID=UPI000CEE02FA|nr:hypothetical protein [Helicobacter bizzozeronii]
MDTIDNRLNMAGQDRGGQGSNKGGGDKPDEKKKPKELKDMTRRELSNLVGRLGEQITEQKLEVRKAENGVKTAMKKLDTLIERQRKVSQELIKRSGQDK